MSDKLKAAVREARSCLRSLDSLLGSLAADLDAFDKTHIHGDPAGVEEMVSGYIDKVKGTCKPLRDAEDAIRAATVGWWGPSISEITGKHNLSPALDKARDAIGWLPDLVAGLDGLIHQLRQASLEVQERALPDFDADFLISSLIRMRTDLMVWIRQIGHTTSAS